MMKIEMPQTLIHEVKYTCQKSEETAPRGMKMSKKSTLKAKNAARPNDALFPRKIREKVEVLEVDESWDVTLLNFVFGGLWGISRCAWWSLSGITAKLGISFLSILDISSISVTIAMPW